jgi:copper chaperone NosL
MRKINSSFVILLNLFLLFTLTKCGGKPEPINYGSDECEFCRMLISDKRYGAELISDKGKVYKFDSIECLVNFALVKNLIGDEKQIMLVTNFRKPENFINCKKAFYVHNESFRSPMGLNVSSFGDQKSAQKFLSENGGAGFSWFDVIEKVKQSQI